ncbi:ATP-binding cassette domain-containing protein [Gilvimarinus sp. SDUM040013]|uniref:ATP-binding protein Uup n=1 Tax=Gilvimarinus gilvus TaxID=3058038 RepID=A0ABU4RXY4_9GAMM|nr:ATP-binding cassette domain-containing protein [Gilvimarinus sp. SDUM040013]MDO3386399.1 ATP-binding cassette domain-containing protein [Gilvimarinus sp. SDUM040013]MDX6849665.1 ATP-binding cassette domain-containing protein [Gilvimarinus sp. SDUM040013]
MPLITVDKAHLNYGLQVLLDGVDFVIEKGQRWCLIGRNGAGKSSFLKTLTGDVVLDGGAINIDRGVRVARLSQDLPDADDRTVFDVVAAGVPKVGELLRRYNKLLDQQEHGDVEDDWVEQLTKVQTELEARDGWSLQQRVDLVLTRLHLTASTPMDSLSGGWRRRVALAQALVLEPDVLLLDEPTNHLDIGAIEWLETELKSFEGAIVFITHDRALLQSVATHIAELDRGQLRTWQGDYRSFLDYRERTLAEEARHNELFDKKLAQEEVWIRQGIKARRTRNEGRVRALKAMREEHKARRKQQGTAKMDVGEGGLSGKLVAELKDVNFAYGGKPIVRNFTSHIIRGDRIGLVGPNGAGKSTLLKLILGLLEPDSGKVKLGTNLSVAYFDQLRDQLNLDKSAVDNVSEGSDTIEINGKSKHIISYLSDFLFSGERARTPVRALSGGERNRVLLAKLFSKSANILVLDEPTNDLDVETLELLEEVLGQFSGTVLLVSHDRAFLNNLVSSVIAFEGGGAVREYVGGYDDWLRQGGKWVDDSAVDSAASDDTPQAGQVAQAGKDSQPKSVSASAPAPKKKLSYKLQREFDALPGEIETLEVRLDELQSVASGASFYAGDSAEIEVHLQKLADVQQQLEARFERWAELEEMGGNARPAR